MATVAVLGVLEVIARPHLDHVHGAGDEHNLCNLDHVHGARRAAHRADDEHGGRGGSSRRSCSCVQGDHRNHHRDR